MDIGHQLVGLGRPLPQFGNKFSHLKIGMALVGFMVPSVWGTSMEVALSRDFLGPTWKCQVSDPTYKDGVGSLSFLHSGFLQNSNQHEAARWYRKICWCNYLHHLALISLLDREGGLQAGRQRRGLALQLQPMMTRLHHLTPSWTNCISFLWIRSTIVGQLASFCSIHQMKQQISGVGRADRQWPNCSQTVCLLNAQCSMLTTYQSPVAMSPLSFIFE